MSKERMKKEKLEFQNYLDSITGLSLKEKKELLFLFDTHREIPKAAGGTYEFDNYGVTAAVAHMKEHGNYRERDSQLETLKSIIDDREQVKKVTYKVNNQLLAYARKTDHLNEITEQWLKDESIKLKAELHKRDMMLSKFMKEIAKETPLAKSALGVDGIGPITVAYCLSYIDLEKARHASSLWSYVGLDKPSYERYEKGKSSGGNKNLRTILYTMAESQMKTKGSYRPIYDQVKERLSISEKIVKTRNTQGKMIECAWKDTKPSHRHGAALRAIMKHFLADYWYVGRTLAGLDTSPLYPEAVLGGNHRTIMPIERGWEY